MYVENVSEKKSQTWKSNLQHHRQYMYLYISLYTVFTYDDLLNVWWINVYSDLLIAGWWSAGYWWSDEDCRHQGCHNDWSSQCKDSDRGNRSPGKPGCAKSLCLVDGADIRAQPQLPKTTDENFWGISKDTSRTRWTESQPEINVAKK